VRNFRCRSRTERMAACPGLDEDTIRQLQPRGLLASSGDPVRGARVSGRTGQAQAHRQLATNNAPARASRRSKCSRASAGNWTVAPTVAPRRALIAIQRSNRLADRIDRPLISGTGARTRQLRPWARPAERRRGRGRQIEGSARAPRARPPGAVVRASRVDAVEERQRTDSKQERDHHY
jgi:hypothetical protein